MASRPTGFLDFHIVGNERGVQQMLDSIDSALSVTGIASFLYGDVGPWIKKRASDRFANEGDDVTGKWAPLQQSTIDIRMNAGFEAGPINKRTGELEAYITQGEVGVTSSPGVGVLKYPQNEPESAGLRTKMKTAQSGRAQPKTVARPVLGMNERDLSEVLVMLAFFVQTTGRLRRAGA